MKEYKDLNGNSGIVAYEISDAEGYIDLEFVSGGVYRYTRENLGVVNFEVMKALAEAGAGLCGFVSKIRHQYSASTANRKPTRAEVDAAIHNLSDMIALHRS